MLFRSTGDRATERCDRVVTEWFAQEDRPDHDCDAHVLVHGRAMVELPSKYGAWARREGLPLAQNRAALRPDDPVQVQITSPRDGLTLLRDPEAPAGMDTLLLQATVDPPVPQVVWYVDGEPVATVHAPYELRWPVQAGEHTFEVRAALQHATSQRIRISAM